MSSMALLGSFGWYEFFVDSINRKEGGVFDLVSRSLDGFDNNSATTGKDIQSLVNQVIKADGVFFILVPLKGKKVQVIHSCFAYEEHSKDPSLIGIAGGRRTSPFRIKKSSIRPKSLSPLALLWKTWRESRTPTVSGCSKDQSMTNW
jgi:hypothetical protein